MALRGFRQTMAQASFQAGAHAALGGIMTTAQGGNFWSGALSGLAGSAVGSATGAFVGDAGGFWQGAGTVVAGGVAGGNFWDGVRNGVISAALNHVAHRLQQVDPGKLKARIEADGVITLSEAKRWYRNGNGRALEADFSKIDFSRVFPDDFSGINIMEGINLFFKGGKDALVYGSMALVYKGNNLVESAIGYDRYDFNADGRFFRDIFTKLGSIFNGSGTSYRINFYGGAAYIGESSPYYNPCAGNQCGRK